MSDYVDSLLAFKEDIENKTLLDWLKAHTSLLRPLHRYVGSIEVNNETLSFDGKDDKRDEIFNLHIPRRSITGIHLGFDEIFRRFDDRALGLFHFVPLNIQFRMDTIDQSIYVFANYSRLLRQSDNKKLFDELNRQHN